MTKELADLIFTCIVGSAVLIMGALTLIIPNLPEKPKKPTVKLPCNIGDVIWFDTYSGRGINEGLKPHEVLDFKVFAVVQSDRGYPCNIDISEFGKTVFLTKKGAKTYEK